MGRLEDKVAIISGGARGMGASHARAFVAEGAKVVITDVLDSEGEALAEELGDSAVYRHLDVTDAAAWAEAVAAAEEAFGPVTVLVNNAGIAPSAGMEDTTVELFDSVIAVNLKGTFLGMHAVLPSMRTAGAGAIVNISSIAGITGFPSSLPYVTSKWGVRGMTKAAAIDLAPSIRVNSVHPGFIETPMIADAKETMSAVVRSIPLQRIADVDEVTKLVVYLASDESSYSTGSEFIVDGGLTAQ